MARIIAIGNEKGGVGKTTTTINLAAGLAAQGRRVLIVDTDTQGHASKGLGIDVEDTSIKGLYDFVLEGVPLGEALIEVRPNLYVLAGGENIALMNLRFTQASFGLEAQLSRALDPLSDSFHYILIDNAPSRGLIAVNVAFYAKELLCPVNAEAFAVDGLTTFLNWIRTLQEGSDIVLKYIVPTDIDGRLRQSRQFIEALDKRFGSLMCEPIRTNVKLSEAPGVRQSIFEYAPQSRGAEDYAKLVARIISDE